MENLQSKHIKFEINGKTIEFDIEHNLPEISGMSLEDAVNNWIPRTNEYTAESLSAYINGKPTGHHCQPVEELVHKHKWWGYKHVSGTYQAKRYFDEQDVSEAKESAFSQGVVGPFMAANREEALEIVEAQINK